MAWLEDAAQENARNMTSETVYRLTKSLERDYSISDVRLFQQQCPTESYNASFGLRMAGDLKEALRIQGKKHGNSLNKELVMRLFFSHREAHHSYEIAEDKSGTTSRISISKEEDELLSLYRGCNPKRRQILIDLAYELMGPY